MRDRLADLQFIALHKGPEQYLFFYTDATRKDVLRAFGAHAANPLLSFSWEDAAVLGKAVRERANQCAEGQS